MKTIKHGEWEIELVYSHIRGDVYSYSHESYDGPGDDRCGTAFSVEDAIEAINEYEHAEAV